MLGKKQMPGRDPRLKDLYLEKPECVIDLPPWLLPPEKLGQYGAASGLAIVEIAGRDSFAAAVKSTREEAFTDLLPTYVYTGTEFGPWETIEKTVERLAMRVPEVRVHDLIVLGSPGLWQALNGRFISELMSRYGFYTPCVGCHLYLHSVRIPLSVTLGRAPIISGEREHHDGSIKVNQIPEALDSYEKVAKGFGVRLVFPLRHIGEGSRILEIVGFDWQGGNEQLDCVFSGNYHRRGGSVQITPQQVQRYLEEFAVPCIEQIVASYTAGYIPNHVDIAAEILGI
jgi:hypothetical protein